MTSIDAPIAAEEVIAVIARESARTPVRIEALLHRIIDLVLSAGFLLLSLPILFIVAIAVRFDSPGPAIFRQTRVGKDGRLFTFYKFRGMYVDASERWPELYAYNFSIDELHGLRFHPERDPRVTRVGCIIRKSSVDELLNFWNVLKGDMSVVGPRPEIPEMIAYYGDAKELVLAVKPGITSLAKVTGRDELTFSETLALDVLYVRRKSPWLDAKIVVATAATVMLQRGVLPG